MVQTIVVFIDLESEGTGSDARPSNLKHLYQKYFHFHYRCKLLHSTPWSMDQKIWSRIRRLGGGWRLDQKGRVRCSSIKPGSSLKHLHRKYFHHHCHANWSNLSRLSSTSEGVGQIFIFSLSCKQVDQKYMSSNYGLQSWQVRW